VNIFTVQPLPFIGCARNGSGICNACINGDFHEAIAEQFEDLKRHSQEAEEKLFIKPHGAG
jgi:hypothetical protein